MAVNEIQSGRYNAVLHKLLSMKEGAPSPILAPEIIPVLPIESDRPEWAFLAGELLAWGFVDVAASVGDVDYFELSNPAGSGVLCVVEKVVCSSPSTNDYYLLGLGTYAPSTAPTAGIVRDSRQFPGRPTCNFTGAAVAASPGGSNAMKFINGSNVPLIIDLPIVLAPGSVFSVQSAAANIAMQVSVAWRERTLEPSETR